LWACGAVVATWLGLTFAAVESAVAARVIAVAVVTATAVASLLGVVAVSKRKRLVRRATRVGSQPRETPP
jgi:hypothetical protein